MTYLLMNHESRSLLSMRHLDNATTNCHAKCIHVISLKTLLLSAIGLHPKGKGNTSNKAWSTRTDGNSKRQDTVIDDGKEAGQQSKARKQNKSMRTHVHDENGLARSYVGSVSAPGGVGPGRLVMHCHACVSSRVRGGHRSAGSGRALRHTDAE